MFYCQNCGKRTGHKRTLGFGTFFAVVITFGLWIIAIPFYPKRCITCGELRSVNFWNSLTRDQENQKKTWSTVALVVLIVIILYYIMSSINSPTVSRDTNARTYSDTVSIPISATPPPNLPDIHVQALDYLNTHNSEYEHTSQQYEGRIIFITGSISGIFIPPPSVRYRMAQKGLKAEPFIYFSDKPVSDATEALMHKGVHCYIDESLEAKASQMHIGQSITLRCIFKGYQTFTDCTFTDEIPSTTSESPQEPSLANSQMYVRYCNERFGFCVEHPGNLAVKPPPENGDGKEFYDGKGFSMSISGINNVIDNSLESQMIFQGKDFDKITYQTKGMDWYVLTGYKGPNVLYLKTYIGTSSINHLYIQYPSNQKMVYDDIVTDISKSFKPGNLNQSH